MKKILMTLSIILCTTSIAVAQPRAVGARVGGDVEISYQHGLGNNMLDLSAGMGFNTDYLSFGVAGAYDWLIPINSWDYAGEWTFYAGPAAGVGFRTYNYHVIGKPFPLSLSVGGQAGIEYAFDFPLNLSIDYRPMINLFGFGSGNHYWMNFTSLAIGVSYRF